jgi:prepilin-type processing-associated H-X9-DG protein
MVPAIEALLQRMNVYTCPSDLGDPNGRLVPSYLGVQGGGIAPNCGNSGCSPANDRAFFVSGLFMASSRIRFADIVDGSSNVFMVAETRYSSAAWASSAKQDSCAFTTILVGAMERINLHPAQSRGIHLTRGFSSYHPGGCNVVLADGSVHFLSEVMNLAVYQQLGRRNDRLPNGGFNP